MNQSLPQSLRIQKPHEIRQILAQGQKHIGNHIILYCLQSSDTSLSSKAGFLSPKRLGKAAKRNQLRRRLREIFRLHRSRMTGSQQILIMGRTSAINATYQALQEDFLRLCRKARLLPE